MIVVVAVAEPVIVDVHLNGTLTAPVGVIGGFTGFRCVDHAHGSVPVHVHVDDHGSGHDHGHDHGHGFCRV